MDNADYLKTHKDYTESVDATSRAVVVMKAQQGDKGQALMQVDSLKLIPAEASKVIRAFLSTDMGDELNNMDVSAPQANAYEFQSQGVVDMLEKLGDKFEDQRTDSEKKESQSRHAFQMLEQDLTSNIDVATDDRAAKAEEKAAKHQKAAEDKGDLADTTATRDSDQAYLDDLVATCTQKSSDFENRQQLRTDELAAIDKAVEIMSSGAVSGAADKHLPALVQKQVSFLQLSASARNPAQDRVADFLREKGSQMNSRVLSALAVRVANDPFNKVRKMIKDLIVRLMEEANEEAEHKGWCDTELSTNEQTRKEKTSSVETLHSEIDELSASIAKLSQDITDLSAEIAASDTAVAEATAIRNKENEDNAATVKDSQEAQTAVSSAVTVLKEFYEKAGEATSFIQTREPADAPESFDTPYTGMQSGNGGVTGMLEVIASDFARLETETKASEATNQGEFDKFNSESAMNRATNAKDVEHKERKKVSQESALTSKNADLDGTQKELDSALAYYDKLKPSCVDAGVSFEDRVARRKDELESLQEALRILNGEDIAFLQK